MSNNKLREYAELRLRIDGEIDALKEHVASINAEVKAEGYTVRAFNAAVKRLRMTPEKRQEAEQLDMDFDLYWSALHAGDDE